MMWEKWAQHIRYGFATNSSSSHSILLFQEEQQRKDADVPEAHYGWDAFTLASKEEKDRYVHAQIAQNFQDVYPVPWEVEKELRRWAWKRARECLGTQGDDAPHLVCPVEGIDHQSVIAFPTNDRYTGPDKAFARWFREQVLDDKVVIFGGNDNDYETMVTPTPGVSEALLPTLPLDTARHPRIRDDGGHWVLFDTYNGHRYRIPKVRGQAITKGAAPELVDVKITDACGFGCAFCYQGSTPEGKHGALGDLPSLLEKMGVMELAIGGGEPLEHPGFWQFVSGLAYVKIAANVTTRRLDKLFPEILRHADQIKAVGCSMETLANAQKAIATFEHYYMREKLVLHLALGTMPMDTVVNILRLAEKEYVEVLLLDYKTDGRGASFAPHPYEDWVTRLDFEFVKGECWMGPKIGVDTPLAEKYGQQIIETLRVDPRRLSPGEGKFSAYLDAVKGEWSRSSYGEGRKDAVTFSPKGDRDWTWAERTAGLINAEFAKW